MIRKILLLCAFSVAIGAQAMTFTTPIKILNSKHDHGAAPTDKLIQAVRQNFDVEQYREVRVQTIFNSDNEPDHLLVYLHYKGTHRMELVRLGTDSEYNVQTIHRDYMAQPEDMEQQPGHSGRVATCPDATIEFIAFAPNDDDLEQNVTKDVAAEAIAKNLKTVQLLKGDATRDAYLNYMTCPLLKGNFYDGDSNPSSMVTVDGMISADDYSSTMRGQFKYNVTNIWLACEAYNDPMLTAVRDTAQSKKYAAGINDLQVGPSDNAAACAMKAAIDKQPMTAAFQDCYTRLDTSSDHWGFGGSGTDNFYQ